MKRIIPIVAVLLAVIAVGVEVTLAKSRAKTPPSDGDVQVLYAGSMTNTMEQKIGPAFHQSSGISFEGQGAGSAALAQMIRSKLKDPDVFISASPAVNRTLLMGEKNHNLVKWYVTVARDSLVIAYNPHSRFASDFKAAANGSVPWYQVLLQPGFMLGRTDPVLDPKGANTAIMFELASRYYKIPKLDAAIMGGLRNPRQVFPEENLLADLNLGQMDAVVAYKHEAIEWGVPYVTLPSSINLGDINQTSFYAQGHVTVKGKVTTGAPIVFTATIPEDAKNKTAAESFMTYILHGDGHKFLLHDGFTSIPAYYSGSVASIPVALKPLLQGKWTH